MARKGGHGAITKVDRSPDVDKLNWVLVQTLDDFNRMVDELKEATWIAFDIETTGLDPFPVEAKVVCLAFAVRDKQWVVPLSHRESKFKPAKIQTLIASILEDTLRGKKIIGHNGKFDSKWMRVKFGIDIPIHFDTMLADFLIDENHSHALDSLAAEYFGAPPYDISLKEKTGGASIWRIGEYAALDVYYTYRLKNYLLKRLKKDEGQALYKLFKWVIMPASRMFVDVECHGIFLDRTRMEEVQAYLDSEVAKAKEQLDSFKKGINWNSTQQVAKLLFTEMKISPIGEPSVKTGHFSTAESVLLELAKKHKVARVLLEYRGLTKLRTFITSWKEKEHGNRLHPSFRLSGAVTGRLSCAEPNLQQVPRNKLIRSLLNAPPGWTFVEADQSQVELRVVAMVSGERHMKRILQTGGDIHTSTARSVLGRDPKDKEERKKAKAVNFGFVYGMGHKKFKQYAKDNYGVEISEREAKAYRQRFFESYPGLVDWHDKMRAIAERLGYVRCLDGRIRHLPDAQQFEDFGAKAAAERQAINSPVQGFASDVTIMGAIDLHRMIARDRFRIVGTVHDAILMEVKNEYLEDILPLIKHTMENPPTMEKLKIEVTVPLIAEVSVGPWGSGLEWEEE